MVQISVSNFAELNGTKFMQIITADVTPSTNFILKL